MRHTNHALTFLRQHYRAVLKHAYALGIAATFVFGLSLIEPAIAATTVVSNQSTANALLNTNTWQSGYQIQIENERVNFQTRRFDITIASEDNFIKNTLGALSTLYGPSSSIELNGENASFEIGNSSLLELDQFTLTKGTLTINSNGSLKADLNMKGGTFSGSLKSLRLNYDGTKRKITFTQGGNFITSGFTPLSNIESSLDITVESTSAEGSSLISIQPGATVTLPKGNIKLGSDLTVTGGTLNIGNNVNLTATSEKGALNINSADSAATLQVDSARLSSFITSGSQGKINLTNASSLLVSGDTAVDLGKGVTFDSSAITVSGSNFNASEAIEGSNASISAQSIDLSYSGTASEIKTLTGTNGLNITGTAALKVDTLNLATSSNGDILVGTAASQTATNSVTRAANNASNATPRTTSTTADLSIAKLDLAGNSLAASADSSAPAAVVAIGELVNSNGSSTSSAGTTAVTNQAINTTAMRSSAMRAPANAPVVLANPTPMSINNGNIVALQNAIVGVGVSDTATLRRTFNTGNVKYLDSNGQLNNSDGVKSILYVDQHVSLDSSYRLIADGSTKDLATALSNAGSNNIYIGENSAVAVPVSIATNDAQAAIHINTTDATAKGGTNSRFIIVDGITTQDLTEVNLLSDTGGSDGTDVKIADNGQDIKVVTLSGRFGKVLKAGQSYSTVTLEKVGGSGGSQGGGSGSNPGSGGGGSTVLPPETSKPTHDATEDYIDESIPEGEYNPVLDYTVLFDGSETTAETVARLGPYGGVAHSALAASNATYSSIATRMGLGAMRLDEAHLASNANGAVLWLNPLYRSSSSDDFANEGQGYGVDVDLYGVALGADVALNPSWRIGALFNVGSGSVDGSGAGAAVDNDFDYYSLGTYSAFTTGAFTLVGDVSYTAVSNDVSATTPASSIGKVGADIDCSSFSFGLTSKFDFSLGDFTLSPHIGMRYSHLDIDDYDVTGRETYASFAAQSMDVFSAPVGVMLATDIAAGDWQVQPALDLTITPHFGDTELKGDVIWTGVSIRSYSTVTEVLDDVTYGATLGIAASNGALSFGLSLSYTGSSNTDELGLQANARLSF